ncbi:kelch-like protein 10 [Ornithodoros turicata]|uniref:kelch-like protein 10 n=1 Tax=Ornithodoros turicata TaxID=34597 RepID=UPI0031394274
MSSGSYKEDFFGSLAVLETEDGSHVAAFKDALCACSEYFDALFNRPLSSKHRDMYPIPGIAKPYLTAIVRYANTGETHINDDNVEMLLEAADQFLVAGLLKRCCDYVAEKINVQNCVKTLQLTHIYFLLQLRCKAHRFLLDNFEQVYLKCPDFCEIMLEDMTDLLASDELKVRREETVWEATTAWLNANLEERSQYVAVLLPHIRFWLMKASYIKRTVLKSALLAPDARDVIAVKCRMKGVCTGSPFLGLPTHRIPSDIMFVYGGIHCSYKSNTWEVYDYKMNQWSTVHTTFDQEVVFGLQCAAVDHVIYVMGANIAKMAHFCYSFDAVAMTWSPIDPMKQLRAFFGVAVLDKSVFCIGGSPNGVVTLDSAERYDTSDGTWKKICSMNHPRFGAGATSCNGRVYIIGGMSTTRPLASVEAYDPLTDCWTLVLPMKTERLFHGVVTYRGKIYVIGGLSRKSVVCEVYNPTTDRWCKGPKTKTLTDKAVAVVLDDRIFAIGEVNQKDYQRCLEFFSEDDMKWHAVSSHAPPRWFYSACVLRNLPNAVDYVARPKRIDLPFVSSLL